MSRAAISGDLLPARPTGDMGLVPQFSNPFEERRWDELVSAHRESSVFHGAAWARVLHDTYGHRPLYSVAFEGGQLCRLLPLMEVSSPLTGRRGISLPFTDECQPIGFASSDYQVVLKALMGYGRERRWKCLECRGGRELAGEVPASLCFYGHTLDLQPGEKGLLARFEGAVRRAIRKAEENGVKVQIAATLEAVRTYYRLHCETRKRHGLPPQPWSFFSNIYGHIVSKEKGFVSLASYEGKPIAGAVFFVLGRQGLYKFGASSQRFLPLRGNNLLMWEAIKWLSHHGFAQLDFGRTAMANEGLRRFKLGWRAAEKKIEYFKYDFRSGQFVCEEDVEWHWYSWIFRCMPQRLSRLTGALLYRHQS